MIAQITGKPIQVVQVDDEAYASAVVQRAGVPAPLAKLAAGSGPRSASVRPTP